LSTFCVAHLSDLHISNYEEPSYSRVRDSLSKDISELLQNEGLDVDALCVTGDIVDKGGGPDAYRKASEFFSILLSNLELSKKQLFIVPGNHDIPRRDLLIPFLETNDPIVSDKQKINEIWEIFSPRFKDFSDFIEHNTEVELNANGAFGGAIRQINTSNGSLRIILLNTAWTTTGTRDYNNLYLSQWQLENLTDASKDFPSADLILALGHHPLQWLTTSESELATTFLKEPTLLHVNAYLHGHVHDTKITRTSDPDGSLLELLSGIGYPESSQRQCGLPKMSKCRYAIYKFDCETGNLDVWLRITGNNGTFASDTQTYAAAKQDGHLSMPFKTIAPTTSKEIPVSQFHIEVDQIPMVYEWVGRETQMAQLLNPKIKAAAITGIGGQGKTYLAAEFLYRYTQGQTSRFSVGIWVNCRELPDSLHLKIIQVLEALSEGKESQALYKDEKIEETSNRLIRHLRARKILVVLDNIDAYVKENSEGAVAEFKSIIDAILTSEHSSLLLFTCRPPFSDSRASFTPILLSGFSEEEGIEFFKKRGIELKNDNNESSCREIVKLTNGHPWWLGLIAGQVSAQQDTLRQCITKFSRGEATGSGAIKEYFKDIWKQLGSNSQQLLRYFVEAPRPLTIDELHQTVIKLGPKHINKTIRRLERLGLLDLHTSSSIIYYQVHPLIREFVHESYSPKSQNHYVQRVLYIFLPKFLADELFNNTPDKESATVSLHPRNLIESVETCLNSRNGSKALLLLKKYQDVLLDNRFHHQFLSIACRTMDSVDWEISQVSQTPNGLRLLGNIIHLLYLMGDKPRGYRYLKRLEFIVKQGSVEQLQLFKIAAEQAWCDKDYIQALKITDSHKRLHESLKLSDWEKSNAANTYALSLRDSGQVKEALEFFLTRIIKDNPDPSNYGNIARCFAKQKDYIKAENYVRQSLIILLGMKTFLASLNTGYAYLWTAEIMYEQQKYIECNAFLLLARQVWSEYAPGLSYLIQEAETNFTELSKKEPVGILEAKEILTIFISEIANSLSIEDELAILKVIS